MSRSIYFILRHSHFILQVLLIFCCSPEVKAQDKKPYFKTLDVAAGLPERFVMNSLEDRHGYLWLGTQNGLVRYDGYQLKHYPIINEHGDEIVNVAANYLFEDHQGKIWMQVGGEGFYYYERHLDAFKKQNWGDPMQDSLTSARARAFFIADSKSSKEYWIGLQYFNNPVPFRVLYFNAAKNTVEEFSPRMKGRNHVPANYTIDMRQDANGKVWLIADSLLSYFDSASKSFMPWFTFPDNKYQDQFESFRPDPEDPNILWMNSYNRARTENPALPEHPMPVIRFNTRTKKYDSYFPNPASPGALPSNGTQVYVDALKRIWISTEKGISLFNREHLNFRNFPMEIPVASGNSVIASDKSGNLWIGGQGYLGLYYLDIQTATLKSLLSKGEPGDLPNSGIQNIFFDKSGTLWVNNVFDGISFVDRQKTIFAPTFTKPRPYPMPANGNPPPLRIVGNDGDSICFIRDSTGLFAWHVEKNTYDKITLKGSSYNEIYLVSKASDGSLWISNNTSGLYNYDPKTRNAINYTAGVNDTLHLTGAINALAEQSGILWIGTRNRGLLSFDKKSGIFTSYPFIINDGLTKAENTLDDVTVIDMLFDSDGFLWVGTNLGGLNRVDAKSKKITSFFSRKDGLNCVVSIYEDKQKRLWVGTYLSGLYLFDRKTGTYKRYSERDGLSSSNARTINEDAGGNIWVLTDRGLCRLDFGASKFTSFDEFKLSERNDAMFKDKTGNFYFYTKEGFVSFDPMLLNDNKIPPSVHIESVSYRPSKSTALTDTVLFAEGRKDIRLKYNENKITFSFVALHFTDPAKNQYSYQLVGYDDDWVQAGANRTVTYTNLAPGTYEFKARGANSDGVWNESAAVLEIVILPPWWQTWWAYILYAVLFGGAIWSYIQYRSRSLRKENQQLEEKVNHRTNELQKSLADLKSMQAQLVQSEKMASLGELTAGIAHEIQNPLNFVNNFSEVNKELVGELQHELKTGNTEEAIAISNDIRDNEEKINYHGKRADAIVKGMLQHSRTSNGETEPTDINALCDEYFRLAYHGLRAKDKEFNATLNTNFDDSIGKINIVPQDFGRVLLNIITNAFYAVAEKKKAGIAGYSPAVSVSTKKQGNKMEIIISDNGNGIPAGVMDKIFQPFFTTKPTGQGTGLGLSLAYDIIKAHGGEISVKNKQGHRNDLVGGGAEFIITLPGSESNV